MFIHWIFFLCTVTSINLVSANKDLKLILVQMLYRHGDRAPLSLYPTDPNSESAWPEGLGELTLLGKQQHYNLGKYFRKFYKGFHTSSPLEVNVTSTENKRCIESAEANLASFYAPRKPWKFEESLDWQPIPIKYLPKSIDKYLYPESDCPRATEEYSRVENSPEGKEYNAKHQEMYNYLEKHSGTSVTDWMSAGVLRDIIVAEKLHNLTIPDWVEPYWNEWTDVSGMATYFMFSTPLLQRLRTGPFLQKIIESMEDKIEGKIPNLKFQVFSAHDASIVVLLLSLKLFHDFKQPAYCATVLIELYSDANNASFVRLLYLNSTDIDQTPYILELEGCTEFCPLQYFVDYTKHLIPIDWEKECQLSESYLQNFEKEEMRLRIIAFTVVCVVVCVSFAVAVFRMYSSKSVRRKTSINC